MSTYHTCQKSCHAVFTLLCLNYFWFGSQEDSIWVYYEGFSSQLYNILLVPIYRYVSISNFEMLFHHIPTRGVATCENDLGTLLHIPLISASEAQQFIPRSSASAIASEPDMTKRYQFVDSTSNSASYKII